MTGITRSRLPKVAPDTIPRERLSSWMRSHADYPVRLLAAPSGSGKTTALVTYAAAPRHRAVYFSLDQETGTAQLCAAIAEALGFERTADPDTLRWLLADAGRCEVLIDDADRTTPDAREVLRRLVLDGPENVTFAFAVRSLETIDAMHMISTGLGVLLTADRLAFTLEEAARFLDAAHVTAANEREIARLVEDTEGWAFALCSAVRDAASVGRTLEHAVDGWRRTNARLIACFVEEALAGEDEGLAVAARRVFDGGSADESTLDELEQRGLFVRWADGAFRPYRVLARPTRAGDSHATNALPACSVSLFGPPEARIGAHRLEWVRRRDAQLFAFIAMQPNGRASRRAIVEAFWPRADRQSASQSLRTTCSTLRRAFTAVVGCGALAHYISFGEEIALNLELCTVDARLALAHLANGDAAWLRGDVAAAREHADAVLGLALHPFLNDDVPDALHDVSRLLRAGTDRARCYADGSAPGSEVVAV